MQITAANAWVEKLVAGTVLAQKLFAKEITIPSGGVIQSQNFSEGTQGFRILGNGKIEINDGYLKSSDFTPSGTSGWAIGYPTKDNVATKTLIVEKITSAPYNSNNIVNIDNIKSLNIQYKYHFVPNFSPISFDNSRSAAQWFNSLFDSAVGKGFSSYLRVFLVLYSTVRVQSSSSMWETYPAEFFIDFVSRENREILFHGFRTVVYGYNFWKTTFSYQYSAIRISENTSSSITLNGYL